MGTVFDSNGEEWSSLEGWLSAVDSTDPHETEEYVTCITGTARMSGSFDEDAVLLESGGGEACLSNHDFYLYSTDSGGWSIIPTEWTENYILDTGAENVIIQDLTVSGGSLKVTHAGSYNRGIICVTGPGKSVELHRVLVTDIASDDDSSPYTHVAGIAINANPHATLGTSVLLHRCCVNGIHNYLVTDETEEETGTADAIGIWMGVGATRETYNRTNLPDVTVRYCTATNITANSGIDVAAYGMLYLDASGHNMTHNLSHGISAGLASTNSGLDNSGVMQAFCYNVGRTSPHRVNRVYTGTRDTGQRIPSTSGVMKHGDRGGDFAFNQSSDVTGNYQGTQADINSFMNEGYGATGRRADLHCTFDPSATVEPLMVATGGGTPHSTAYNDVALNGMIGSENVGAYGYQHLISIIPGFDYPYESPIKHYPDDGELLATKPWPSGWQNTFSSFAAAMAYTESNPPVVTGSRYNWPGGPLSDNYDGWRIGHELRPHPGASLTSGAEQPWLCVTFSPERVYEEQIKDIPNFIGGDSSNAVVGGTLTSSRGTGRPGGEGPITRLAGVILGGTRYGAIGMLGGGQYIDDGMKTYFTPPFDSVDEAFISLTSPSGTMCNGLVQNIKIEGKNKRWNSFIEAPSEHNCIVSASGYVEPINSIWSSSVEYGIVAKQVTNCLVYGNMDYGISSTSSRHSFNPLVYANNTLFISNFGSTDLTTGGIKLTSEGESGGAIAFNNLLLSSNGTPILANGTVYTRSAAAGGETNINDYLWQAGNYFTDVGGTTYDVRDGVTVGWWTGDFPEYDFGLTPTSHAINSGIIPQYRQYPAAETDTTPAIYYRNWFNKGSAWPYAPAWHISGGEVAGSGVFEGGGLFNGIGNGNHMMIDGHATYDTRNAYAGNATPFFRDEEVLFSQLGFPDRQIAMNRFPPLTSHNTFDCGYDERQFASAADIEAIGGRAFIAFMDF